MKPTYAALLTTLFSLSPLMASAAPTTDTAPAATAATASDTNARTAPIKGSLYNGLQTGQKSAGGRNITAFDRPGQRGIGGYFAQEFTANSDGKMFFDQRQMVLQTSAYLHENLFFNAEVEYEHGGNVENG